MQEMFNIGTILAWPIICCLLYKRFDTLTATFISVFGGFLLLPVNVYIDIPLFPKFDKSFSSLIGVIIGITLIKKLPYNWFGRRGAITYLTIFIFLITLINYLFNMEPVFNGEYWLPGITAYEAVAACLRNYLAISFLIVAVNVVKSESDVISLHKLLVIALLIYLPLVIIELIISPQLHKIIYGFHPHSFEQQIRAGGYRAMVFIGHGLLTANVYLGGFIALIILQKLNCFIISKPVHLFLIFLFFLIIILLKSATALALSLISLMILYLFTHTIRMLTLRGIALFAIGYPILVSLDLIPLDTLHESLEGIFAPERLRSLLFNILIEYIIQRNGILKGDKSSLWFVDFVYRGPL